MRNYRILILAAMAVVCGVSFVPQAFSQSLPPAAPKPKSKGEADAIRAVQAATDPDTRLQKIDDVLTKYADTEYKDLLLDMAVQTAQMKGDQPLVEAWAQRDLDANPHSYLAKLALANSIAGTTKEFDLDKQEKLDKAEKLAKEAAEEAKTAPKPVPGIPDDQWEKSRKQTQAEAFQVLGVVDSRRKNYDAAVADYKQALELFPDPNTEVRLGDAYTKQGKYDEAIAELDKALSDPAIEPNTKTIATSLKNTAVKLKAAGIKPSTPATPASGTGPQQVEIKK